MKGLLYVIGALTILVGIIAGFATQHVLGFFLGLIGGVIGASVYLALAKILDNQDAIINLIYRTQSESLRKIDSVSNSSSNAVGAPKKSGYSSIAPMKSNMPQKKCSKCKKEVDDSYEKCPHCKNDSFE